MVGGEALAADERYLRSRERIKAADELEAMLAAWVGARTYLEAESALVEAGVPVGGIFRAEDIVEDPHYQARDSYIEVEDPEQGAIAMPGIIPKLSDTPGEVKWTGPELGTHNQEIYGGVLGLSGAELEGLCEAGVI